MNLDDEFYNKEEHYNKKGNQYSLTPRGILLMSLLKSDIFKDNFKKSTDVDLMMEVADQIWDNFENQVRSSNGMGELVAAVVFNKNGGILASVRYEDLDTAQPDDNNTDDDFE